MSKENDAFLSNGAEKREDFEAEVVVPKEKKCCTLRCVAITLGVLVALSALLGVVGYLHYKTKYEGTAEVASQEDILREVQEDQVEEANLARASSASENHKYPPVNHMSGK